MSEKIGVCCACGDCCDEKATILAYGFEYCPECAELLGIHDEEIDE